MDLQSTTVRSATTASPFPKQLEFGRATSKHGRVYLHVFDWPADGKLRVPAWDRTPAKVHLLASPRQSLKFSAGSDGTTIQLPPKPVDPIATVIVVDTL